MKLAVVVLKVFVDVSDQLESISRLSTSNFVIKLSASAVFVNLAPDFSSEP